MVNFSYQCKLMVFHWSLSNSKSPQVSVTLLSILANINIALVWIVFTRPLISKSYIPSTSQLVTVSSVPKTNGITVTFMFHRLLSSLVGSRYLSLFSLPFNFILWSDWGANVLFFCCWQSLVVWPSLNDPFVWQNPRELCATYLLGRILSCVYAICSYGQIYPFCTISSRSPCSPSQGKVF